MGCVYLCGTGTIRTGTEFIYLSCTKLCPVKSTNMPQNFQRGTVFWRFHSLRRIIMREIGYLMCYFEHGKPGITQWKF